MQYNPAIPQASSLFAPVADAYGNRLALVFGNEFKGGQCPFYQKQCTHCDIGAGEGLQFNCYLNKQRLEFFKKYYAHVLLDVVHLVIYNSGSTLNKSEMSQETLKEILDYVASLENCKLVSFDSREAYITEKNIKFLVANLREDQQARVILGLESHSDEIRIRKLKKRMTKQTIEKVFATLGNFGRKVGLDINILFQPPGLTGEAAISDSLQTVTYCLELAERYNVPIDFNFHPYYPSQKGRMSYPNHHRANSRDALNASFLMKKLVDARDNVAKIFIGWQDEMHDQEQNIRVEELEIYQAIFDSFNISQDIADIFAGQQRLKAARKKISLDSYDRKPDALAIYFPLSMQVGV